MSYNSRASELWKQLTCLIQDLLYDAKQNQLSLFSGCVHVALRRLLMQAWWKVGTVAQAVALRNALLEVQRGLCEELHHQSTKCQVISLHVTYGLRHRTRVFAADMYEGKKHTQPVSQHARDCWPMCMQLG